MRDGGASVTIDQPINAPITLILSSLSAKHTEPPIIQESTNTKTSHRVWRSIISFFSCFLFFSKSLGDFLSVSFSLLLTIIVYYRQNIKVNLRVYRRKSRSKMLILKWHLRRWKRWKRLILERLIAWFYFLFCSCIIDYSGIIVLH